MTKATIRDYRKGDDGHICNVIRSVFEEYGFTWESGGYNSDTEDVQSHYIDHGGSFWVMEVDGKIVGTGGLMPMVEERCELWRLYLLPQFRGKGLGRLFFEYIVSFARDKGYREMEIWSDIELQHAHHLYEKAGAKFIGTRICNDPDNSTENGFILPL